MRSLPPWRWEAPGGVTQAQLAAKREAFWGSQSSGRALVWGNLKLVADALLQGNVELANTLLEAMDVRVPNADLSVCFDALGQLYQVRSKRERARGVLLLLPPPPTLTIRPPVFSRPLPFALPTQPQVPRWVYSSPVNISSEEEAAALARASRKEHVGPVRELEIVLRLSPSASSGEQDVALHVSSSDTARELKEALHVKLTSGDCDQAEGAAAGGGGGGGGARPNKWRGVGLPPRRQRLFFRGKELQADNFLQEVGIESGSVLQVFLMG